MLDEKDMMSCDALKSERDKLLNRLKTEVRNSVGLTVRMFIKNKHPGLIGARPLKQCFIA